MSLPPCPNCGGGHRGLERHLAGPACKVRQSHRQMEAEGFVMAGSCASTLRRAGVEVRRAPSSIIPGAPSSVYEGSWAPEWAVRLARKMTDANLPLPLRLHVLSRRAAGDMELAERVGALLRLGGTGAASDYLRSLIRAEAALRRFKGGETPCG